MIKLYHGDFLEKAKNIPDDSVDLVLTDPPYGTVKRMKLGNKRGHETYSWDEAIEPRVLFEEINRILRKNGKAVLFGQEPFTSRMITEAIPNLPFSYRMIWEKDHFANALSAKKAPVNYYEDIMVLSKSNPVYDEEEKHPLRPYFKKIFNHIGKTKTKIIKEVGQCADHCMRFNSMQFALCTNETYQEFIERYKIDEMENFKKFDELNKIDVGHREKILDEARNKYPSVFNLWEEEPVKDFEDVLVYYKHPESVANDDNPVKEYADKVFDFIGVTTNELKEKYNKDYFTHFRTAGKQFRLCTEKAYDKLIEDFNLENMEGFLEYEKLKEADLKYKDAFSSTFNLWQKKKTKSNILKYAKDYPSLHPTQKPVLLLEDLVKTFSNEGDLVVDLTMGSGSTGVACKNTGRRFIGIEMDDEYFNIAKERIESHEHQLELV